MPAKNKKSKKNINKEANAPTTTEQPKELPVQLPAYKPIDFNATPSHLEVLHKKMRAIKKKLRKIEEVEKLATKKTNPEQEKMIADKGNLTRALRDFEEIEKSLTKLDLTVPLRLWVGVFFAAAATGDSALNDLCTILLPPQNPPPSHSPLRELEHACQVAEHFLAGASAELFNDSTPVTFAQLKDKVVEFLSTPESELIVQPAAPASPEDSPVVVEEKTVVPQVEADASNFVQEETPAVEEPATQEPEGGESRDPPTEASESTEKESVAPQPATETPVDQQAPEEVKSESDGKDRKRGGGGRRGGSRGRGYYNRREDGENRGEYQRRNYDNKNRENGDYHHNNDGNGNYKPRGNKSRGEGGRGNKNYVRRGSPHTGTRNNSNQAQGESTQ